MVTFRRSVLVSLLFCMAGCSDSGSGVTTSATAATSTTTATTTDPTSTSTGVPTTGPGNTTGSGSEGVTSTATTTSASATTTAAETGGSSGEPPGTSTGTGASTTTGTSGEPGTSSGGSSSTSTTGAIEPPPPPGMLDGCSTCECCDPWWISWGEVPGATHYVVRWKCSINPEQVHDVGSKTMIADVCNDIAMCNGMCAFTVGYIKVQACNDDGCSAPVDIPAEDIPLTCGGGCCC